MILYTILHLKNYQTDITEYLDELEVILQEIAALPKNSEKAVQLILRKYPKDKKGVFAKDELVAAYRELVKIGKLKANQDLLNRIKLKPTRTMSGVTTVTVLTKPFPCPGTCIFCPNDVRMPKSYLTNEPGAQRAERNLFDPYLQVYNRLLAIFNAGHNTDKVELIILGGTWSFYPETYQIWFIQRCFDALNDFGVIDQRGLVQTKNIFGGNVKSATKQTTKNYNQVITSLVQSQAASFIAPEEQSTWNQLISAQEKNEAAKSRCVGLVIETRPDFITEAEVIRMRKLGATKVQIGIQSLNDHVLKLNKRGHNVAATAKAFELLRLGGFKIHAHWMPGLYGSDVAADIIDYQKLWQLEFQPDELKLYPVSVIKNTELNLLFEQGKFQPYNYEQTLEVLAETMKNTPRYCRITRVIRDIPSQDIVSGNKFTNFRQIAELDLAKRGLQCQCIRCREVRKEEVKETDLVLDVITYETTISQEFFLSFKTKKSDKIAGFLRLSLIKNHNQNNFITELQGAAMIREVHVYGQVVAIGEHSIGKSQHLGLGTKLIKAAEKLANKNGYYQIAVISAIGTRKYYQKLGYEKEGMYLLKGI
ncbi:MAG: tRNA uridine(34) 5-carboxymethylaminomethyl modification radical SAM/GNAT enzyme Elp3 [bacterium]